MKNDNTMKIWLLTHQRETLKQSNTGQLVQQQLGPDCETIIWQRKQAEPRLLSLLEENNIALLYPESELQKLKHKHEDQSSDDTNQHYENFVIIDSTWQQAKKIMNKSPYLQAMPSLALQVDQPSAYKLRRNQKTEGLCTAEVAIALLKQHQQVTQAEKLLAAFEDFNQR